MAKSLTFEYDRIGDILSIEINGVRPYAEQESDHLNDDEIVARFNPVTGEVENLEILFFNARMQKGDRLKLDLTPDAAIHTANNSKTSEEKLIRANEQNAADS